MEIRGSRIYRRQSPALVDYVKLMLAGAFDKEVKFSIIFSVKDRSLKKVGVRYSGQRVPKFQTTRPAKVKKKHILLAPSVNTTSRGDLEYADAVH